MGALLALTSGCAEVESDRTSEEREIPTVTATPIRMAAQNGLWSAAQACTAITQDNAKDLATILSFMAAQPPDMDHLLEAEAVADDFHELGSGTVKPLGEHLVNLANEVYALIAELWKAGDEWVLGPETFDMSYFEDAVVGLGEECRTPPTP